jgi:hypothetical protein
LVLIGHALCSFCISCIAKLILHCAIYPTQHLPKRWTDRFFLVTHSLPALYKGPIRQSDSLYWVKDPQVRPKTQELRACLSPYFFNSRGLDFLAKI